MGACLDNVPVGQTIRVRAVSLSSEEREWLGAVGIVAGEVLTVLRRAAFGGPMHVRTEDGGEFAIAQSLAAAIETESAG
ncbi:MAG: ferrous iron transport protein A [Polyangiaceae bacterium]|nr:ferrous iron transport protein A [Polyangiaceae bacterium]